MRLGRPTLFPIQKKVSRIEPMIRIRITLLLIQFLLFLPRKLMKGIGLSKLIIRLKTVLSLPIDASSPSSIYHINLE